MGEITLSHCTGSAFWRSIPIGILYAATMWVTAIGASCASLAPGPESSVARWAKLILHGDRERQRAVYPVGLEHNQRAADYYRQALALAEKGEVDRLRMGETLEKLGETYLYLGDLEASERTYLQALEVLEAVLGPDDPRLCTALVELGDLVEQGGDVYFLRCLENRERFYGPDAPQVADSLMIVGVVQMRRGELDRAEETIRRALKIRQADQSVELDDIRGSMVMLRNVLRKLGRDEEAADLDRKLTLPPLGISGCDCPEN